MMWHRQLQSFEYGLGLLRWCMRPLPSRVGMAQRQDGGSRAAGRSQGRGLPGHSRISRSHRQNLTVLKATGGDAFQRWLAYPEVMELAEFGPWQLPRC